MYNFQLSILARSFPQVPLLYVAECLCGHSNKLDATASSSCTKGKRGFGYDELKPEALQKLINHRLAIIESMF